MRFLNNSWVKTIENDSFRVTFCFVVLGIFLHTHSCYAENTSVTQYKSSKTDDFKILGGKEIIFPETEFDTPINPIFKVQQFEVHTALKSKSDQFKLSEKYGGTNTQFEMPKKQIDEKEIPQEIRNLLLKK